MEANTLLQKMEPTNGNASDLDQEINETIDKAFQQMSDDFNTPMALARLFELVAKINGLKAGHISSNEITSDTLQRMKDTFKSFITDIFGLLNDSTAGSSNGNGVTDGLMELIIDLRQNARVTKDWGTSDKIRDSLNELKIQLKDGKDGTTWSKN